MRLKSLRAARLGGLIILGVGVPLLSGCWSKDDGTGANTPKTPGKTLEVYAVNYPLFYLAKTLAGDTANVHFPVPEGVDPAYWEPTTEDIEKLQKADLILLNGADYAKWVEHHSLPEAKLVNTSETAKDRYIKLPDAVVHKHGPEGEHAHEGYASHVWLDPQIMDKQAFAIREAMIALRPDAQTVYEGNGGTIILSFTAIVPRLLKLSNQKPELKVIGSHPMYEYLARYLGWSLKNVHWEPDETPSEEEWQKFSELLAEHPAPIMLWEAEPTEETRNRLVNEFQVTPVVFDPLAQKPASGDYLSNMQENIARLEKALGVEGRSVAPPSLPAPGQP